MKISRIFVSAVVLALCALASSQTSTRTYYSSSSGIGPSATINYGQQGQFSNPANSGLTVYIDKVTVGQITGSVTTEWGLTVDNLNNWTGTCSTSGQTTPRDPSITSSAAAQLTMAPCTQTGTSVGPIDRWLDQGGVTYTDDFTTTQPISLQPGYALTVWNAWWNGTTYASWNGGFWITIYWHQCQAGTTC